MQAMTRLSLRLLALAVAVGLPAQTWAQDGTVESARTWVATRTKPRRISSTLR